MEYEEDLTHFGMLGMKWGIRRTKPSEGSADHRTSRSLMKKNKKTMSNAEMSAVIKRLRLEKEYKEAIKGNISPAQQLVTNFVAKNGYKIAMAFVNSRVPVRS